MSDEWRWLESTKHLQETAFGVDFSIMRGHALADYILVNAYSAGDEIGEALDEFSWKPWAKERGKFTDRDAFVDELVDAAHFVGNLACAAGVTDEEWEQRYRAKQNRNRQRQEVGYDAVRSKCPACRRELDKPGATQWTGRWLTCIGCGEQLGFKSHNADAAIDWRECVAGELVAIPCSCRQHGIGKPSVDAECAVHRVLKNSQEIPM